MIYVEEINKILAYLPYEKDYFKKIEELDALRYFYKENETEKDKVKYDAEKDELILSNSLKVGQKLIDYISKNINKLKDDERNKAVTILQNNYYYLAKYLFSYYLVAIEFGIPAEKQFLAPRTSVLIPIAKKLEKFYYKSKAIAVIAMPQGTGKEQPLSSNILTPNGWIKMGEIKVGSEVIAADGTIAKVTGIFPKGIKDVYRVYFDDNTYVDCGLEHLWEVRTRKDRIKKDSPRIITTEEMLNNVITEKKYKNYSIRLVKPIQFTKKTNYKDLNPYILGSLIANGNFNEHHITFSTSDEEIANKINKLLPNKDILKKYKSKYVYGITKKKDSRDSLGHFTNTDTVKKIKEYGLIGKKSEEKFIPKKFLYSDYEDRIELLRGLMDNDGYINKKSGTSCVYITTSKQLCKDILELIRGLGGKASYSIKQGKYKKNNKYIKCKTVYQICFTIEENPFFVNRKKILHKGVQYNFKKFITKIEKVRQEESQCIMIDHPEHLYVTDGYTLTHNTEIR